MYLEGALFWVFLAILPLVAFLYASVGHGGASGYLALMALFSFPPDVMRPTALLLNLVVAGMAFYYYQKAGYFNKKLFLSFAVASVPMSFWGSTFDLDPSIYKKILAIFLIFSIFKMTPIFGREPPAIKKIKVGQGILIGGGIGFFSGLIGIGGGIILSPLILLLHWGKMKEAAAVSALFIWVNSIAGLAGQLSSGITLSSRSFLLVLAVAVGGLLGGYTGSREFNNKQLRMLLMVVLILASFKLALT